MTEPVGHAVTMTEPVGHAITMTEPVGHAVAAIESVGQAARGVRVPTRSTAVMTSHRMRGAVVPWTVETVLR